MGRCSDAADGRDAQPPRPEPGDARSTAPAAPVYRCRSRRPSSTWSGCRHRPRTLRTSGCGRASRGFAATSSPTLLLDRSVVRMALMRGTIHLVTARGRLGPPAARPAGHGPGPEESVREAPGRRRPRRGRGDGTRLRGRATADVQGARRPPADAMAGPGSVRARAGGANRRAARPGAAARTVGPQRADRPYLDRGLARRTAGGPADHRRGRHALCGAPSGR